MQLFIFYSVVISIQFLIFQHKHFRVIRKMLCKFPLTKFLCHCIFCQCLWIGALVAYFLFNTTIIPQLVCMSLSAACVGMFGAIILNDAIEHLEAKLR